MKLDLDIHTFVQTALIFAIVIALYSLWRGFYLLTTAHKIKFFRLRQEHTTNGWRAFLVFFILGFLAFFLWVAAEPLAYRYFPPTITATKMPTLTISPTITLKPTITETPTYTLTPSESYTPTSTSTPFIPEDVAQRFSSSVTPSANVLFSPIVFSDTVDQDNLPLNTNTSFTNPIKAMYAIFSYDQMQTGVQWTALWYRNRELIFFETAPWFGSTGGYAFSLWKPQRADELLPGDYEVQLFVGMEWLTVGGFKLEGDPPTLTPSPLPSLTPKPTITRRPTTTPKPTITRRPTMTPKPTRTLRPSPSATLDEALIRNLILTTPLR